MILRSGITTCSWQDLVKPEAVHSRSVPKMLKRHRYHIRPTWLCPECIWSTCRGLWWWKRCWCPLGHHPDGHTHHSVSIDGNNNHGKVIFGGLRHPAVECKSTEHDAADCSTHKHSAVPTRSCISGAPPSSAKCTVFHPGLVFILAGALFYGTVSFRKLTSV